MARAARALIPLLFVAIAGIGLQVAVAQPDAPAAKSKVEANKAETTKSKAKTKTTKAKTSTTKVSTAKDSKAPKSKTKETKAKASTAKSKEKKAANAQHTKASKAKDSKAKVSKAKVSKSKNSKAKDSKAAPSARAAAIGSGPLPAARPDSERSSGSADSPDIAATKRAVAQARAGHSSQATEIQNSIHDPVARKLVEWAILRSDSNGASASRYLAFITANPNWPSIGMFRRRAESMMWFEQPDPQTLRAYFAKYPPLSSKGHFTYARALLATGDRAGAQAQARDAWHHDTFGSDLEAQVLGTFGSLITTADIKARMDMRLYAEDNEAALRNANRLGGDALLIAKARIAVSKKSSSAKAALDAVPASARRDLGYIFSLAQWLRRANHLAEAGEAILAAPRDPSQVIDTDQWWIERRLAARNMLDLGDATKAYRIARDAVPPKRENYRGEHQFTAGWIALRFLNDPTTAQSHFAHIADGVEHPTTVARAHYWQARAFEAMGRSAEARSQYQAAAQHPTAYYGQLAGGKLNLRNIAFRSPPPPAANHEVVRAIDLLYQVGQRDIVAGATADLGSRSIDPAILAAIAEVAGRHHDARAMLLLGKAALGQGLPLERYAFPTIGMPNYTTIGPAVEKSLVYAIARQESTFNQKTISRARAMGLMQVTPAAGRYIARKHNVAFNERRLLSDPVYNVQLGAAELGGLLADLRGSYILTFVGYNAGRGRVREWIARYGDPRDPKVDPVDWVERIPFSETRNYVQRIMENLQVYRVRFGGGDRLMIEADLRRGTTAN